MQCITTAWPALGSSGYVLYLMTSGVALLPSGDNSAVIGRDYEGIPVHSHEGENGEAQGEVLLTGSVLLCNMGCVLIFS